MNTNPSEVAEAARNNKPMARHNNAMAKTGPPQQLRDVNLLELIGLSFHLKSLYLMHIIT
jgi:hypothetical protein